MSFPSARMTLLIVATLFVTSACGGGGSLPAAAPQPGYAPAAFEAGSATLEPADTTSILKKFKKDIVIGSTVDPSNGDQGPRAISIAPATYGLKKGQILVCNFDDKAGTQGKGTTLEVLDSTPGSKPTRFYQGSAIQGCDGDAISESNSVYAAGLMSHEVVEFAIPYGKTKYKLAKRYSSPIESPLADSVQLGAHGYSAEYAFVGDSKTGSLIDFSVNGFGHPSLLEAVTGFGVNHKPPGSGLGPSGMQYTRKGDTVYVVDGVTNTIVAVTGVASLLVKDEIVVKPGGKTFDCKQKKFTCAHLVLAGKPLDAPLASALLPNGNLIVANTQGTANTLVELTPTGQVLDTKVVDMKTAQGVFGLIAAGSSDSNTVLFYTDTNDNDVHELEQ